MFSFFRKKPVTPAEPTPLVPTEPAVPSVPAAPVVPPVEMPTSAVAPVPAPAPVPEPEPVPTPAPSEVDAPAAAVRHTAAPAPAGPPERSSWTERLKGGLRKTGQSIAQVFTGTRIDDALYEDLEAALLMADTGVHATQVLLDALRVRVKEAKCTDPKEVRALLVQVLAAHLAPLQQSLEVGRNTPTVMMVVGVNGAGKTTSIGKLTRHLADSGQAVLLAAGDTFRAAAREQLVAWAVRNDVAAQSGSLPVDIVSQEGADPGAVSFDAVTAGRARGKDVVIVDTAGRLPTQLHLMEELKKIRRVIGKAMEGAPHEVLLVVDGNTGQNALAQVKAFDEALGLTGLVVTKLDGTAKGGVLAAIALWGRTRKGPDGQPLPPVPVYFIGVGEQLADLETFDAREFAQALLAA